MASSVLVVVVAAPGATDHDLVLLDRDLDGAVARPVLGIDRVVLDGGVEPQAVALLAMVERALERPCGGGAAAGAAPAAARALGLLLVLLVLLLGGLGGLGGAGGRLRGGLGGLALGLLGGPGRLLRLAGGLLLELRRDLRVVLGPQIHVLDGHGVL